MKKILFVAMLGLASCVTHTTPERYMEKYSSHTDKPIVIEKNLNDAVKKMYGQCLKCFNEGSGGSDGVMEYNYSVTTNTDNKEKPTIKVERSRVVHGSLGMKSEDNDFIAILQFESSGKSSTKMIPFYKYKQVGKALEKWAAGTSEGCPEVPH